MTGNGKSLYLCKKCKVMKSENQDKTKLYLPLITQEDFYRNELWSSVAMLVPAVLKNGRKRKDSDKYILDTFNILNRIDYCLNTINRAKTFISRRPSIKDLDNNAQMTVIDYYYYHYDVVIHKLSTIRDLSYKLINVVFRLGINDRNCGWDSILKKKNEIALPGIMNLQQLYYKLLERIEFERNESTHSGNIDLSFMREIDLLVSMSQMIRLKLVPMDEWDPMAKGSYNEYRLRKCKKELMKIIERYRDMSISFVHILACCLGGVFRKNLSEDSKVEFEKNLKDADKWVNKHEKKNNKLVYLIDWLIHLDDIVKKYSDLEIKVGKKAFEYFE